MQVGLAGGGRVAVKARGGEAVSVGGVEESGFGGCAGTCGEASCMRPGLQKPRRRRHRSKLFRL